MNPLTITLVPEVFAQVIAGEKKVISTKRNPRKDRYFSAKTPDMANMKGETKMKLIRMITGKAKGKYLLLDEEKNRIIHPNGYVSEGCVLPWNGEWTRSERPFPKWAMKFFPEPE